MLKAYCLVPKNARAFSWPYFSWSIEKKLLPLKPNFIKIKTQGKAMSILTRDEIFKEIHAGNITITPYDETKIGPGSVDLHLGEDFRIFKKVHDIIDVNDKINYEEMTELIHAPEGIILMPGETILGITTEVIKLAPNICGWLEGRSRFARLGLLVHISASFMQPGIDNQQVLEMTNFSPMPLRIHPGTAICQFIFQKTIGEAVYEGQFKNQREGIF